MSPTAEVCPGPWVVESRLNNVADELPLPEVLTEGALLPSLSFNSFAPLKTHDSTAASVINRTTFCLITVDTFANNPTAPSNPNRESAKHASSTASKTARHTAACAAPLSFATKCFSSAAHAS